MLEIKEANLADKEAIIALENEFVTNSIKDILFLDTEHIIVTKDNNKVIGYLYMSQILDESEIVSLCVNPLYRKKGIAYNMWQYYIENFNVNYCFLEVRKSNLNAINLYKKIGFLEIGIRKNYYSNNEDAILMKWSR